MKSWNLTRGAIARTLWVALAIVAVAGIVDAGAKDRKRDRDRVHSGYIGVYMQDLTDDVRAGLDLKVKDGVLISGVADDSPAEKAGLDDGDVVVSFNGTRVGTPDELRDAVRQVEPGTEAKMEVVQNGKKKTVTITVGDRPDQQFGWFSAPDAPQIHRALSMFGGPRLGIQAHEISDELGSYFNAKEGDGVLVLDVNDASVAEKAGVQAGDIVQKIDDTRVGDVGDLRDALRDFEEGDTFTITVLRHGKTQPLKATMDDQSDAEFSWNFDGRAPRMHGMHRQPGAMYEFRMPRQDRDTLRDELDELREELKELKEELRSAD
ncbi:MAG: PDZ domain-containing protein [Candidatus Krumholzibacteria bacterium]|nr:PDZ domain-containing protein [Candidatus Krumholzibacteria bacterium]MDH4335936.1 PDZ domain-containing protein [Candidatus Krumholzibacteria bacterium]MDH5268488.1 PDZ domain-containing protein [Candidatus Krumholzibacteria bacterium]